MYPPESMVLPISALSQERAFFLLYRKFRWNFHKAKIEKQI